ncbi:Nuclear pore complex protein Nup133-like Protein [Tribolium castaneum]|uniref:Nuclear pore complex protein Nup133-like Protein n=2 Tax=Tribolium castaneum TaxID=7070 RepID=D6WR92_TRICA|nr:Nuclear pore complex protein Nup133-like Protein [Tribolium castaneum]
MDRSFNSSFSTRSPFSPRSRQNLNAKKIIPPNFRKSSRFSVSGKSTQSVQIILSTPYNYVERFGQTFPVLITEALTFADRNTVVSARISKLGYLWVVCGRRLLIWQYRQSPVLLDTPSKKTSLLNQCFELQLPQSDLAHRAELVSVFVNSDSNTPSCIAVSPEGVVRYWPAIVHEGISVEQHVSLQGQECDSLTDVEGLGCILATTTCTVLLLQPQLSGGRHSLKCKTLKIPTGWLGGISKRMSSLIFGPIASETSAESGIVRVLSVPGTTSDTWTVYVLADHNLQKWQLSKNDEELIFVTELNRIVRDSFCGALWENCVGDQTEIDTWLLDIQSDKDNVIILAAAVNIPRVHYAMISLQTNTNQPPTAVKDFLLLKITDLYRENNPGDSLSYRFLLCGINAYLYNQKHITVIKPQEEPDILEFNTPQDFLLAGAICVNTPIFFSRNHGLVAVASNDMSNDLNLSLTGANSFVETSFNDNVVVNNLSIYNMDPEEISIAYKDTVSQLKAAFIYRIQNQEQACKEIIDELFPPDASKLPGIDSLLDKVVIMMGKDLIDDTPAGDPRWSKDHQVGLGSSHSMQVLDQLKNKQKALSLFIKFLKESGLWAQLSASTIRNTTTATTYIMGEISEKIIAAISLKTVAYNQVLEKAIEKATAESETKPENGLTYQDVFFREVSQVHRGIQEMVNYCEDKSHSNMDPAQIVDMIHDTNEIILGALKSVINFREQNVVNYKPSEGVLAIAPEFLPWTAASGAEGLFNSLSQMHYLTYNYGIILTNNERLRNDLFDQLVSITDIILDGRKSHLESIKATSFEEIIYKQYCSDRQKFMKPFIHEKDWERCAKLAEKYLDFETLMILCEATNNQRRLDDYLERFSNEGFSEFVYNWFLKENKQGKLIDMCKHVGKSKNIQKLTNFLSGHPSLSWMQEIFDKKYNQAANSLQTLALNETESVTRQKTMLSLCKLAKLAAGTGSEEALRSVDSRLDLIAYQEDIPDYVLQQFGYDTINIRVIPPKDLINLYICKEYTEAAELEFKKALDLLNFIDDEELRQEMSLKIWRYALLRDAWQHQNLDSPMEILQHKLFFKLVDLAMDLEGDGWNLLPPMDTLIDDDSLGDLRNNTNFQFLLKAGYEHIYRSQTVE